MKTKPTSAKELIDILELQMELLELALNDNALERYVEVKNTTTRFLKKLFEISTTDFERFKYLIDLSNEEEEQFFEDTLIEKKDLIANFTLSKNKVIRFLIDFYMTGMQDGFKNSDERKFYIFYLELKDLFQKVTSVKYLKSKKQLGLLGEEYSHSYLETQFFLDEAKASYYDFVSTKDFRSDRMTYVQTRIKTELFFEMHISYFFHEEFHLGSIVETLTYIERLLIEQIIDFDDDQTFERICSGLFVIADQRSRERDELKFILNQDEKNELSALVESSHAVASIQLFNQFKADLELQITAENEDLLKRILKSSEFNLKYALLRFMFIRIGAKLIRENKNEMIYSLLFSRQPLEADYINSNKDFFPTEADQVSTILSYQDQTNFNRMIGLERISLAKERDQFVVLWIFRNYLWQRNQGYEKSALMIQPPTGLAISQLKRFIDKLLLLAQDWHTKANSLLTFGGRIKPDLIEDFMLLIEGFAKEIEKNQLEKIRNAKLEDKAITEFKNRTIIDLNSQKSLINFLLGDQKLFKLSEKEVQNSNIKNSELFDKGPYIDKDLSLNPSINADSVFPNVMARNLSANADSYLFRKIKEECKTIHLTTNEMNDFLLSTSFKGKTILGHYVHFGFELLREQFTYNSIGGKHEGTFPDFHKDPAKVYTFYSQSQLKFIMILNSEMLSDLIDISGVDIDTREFQEDTLKIIFEAKMRLLVKEMNGKELGTIYYLR